MPPADDLSRDRALTGHPLRSTPSGLRSRPGVPRELPEDLLRQASRRLCVMCLVAAVLWIVAPLAGHLAYRAASHDPNWARLDLADAISAVNFVLSIGLFLYIRNGRHAPGFVLDLGLVYMVTACFSVGAMMHWGPIPGSWQLEPMISWTGVVILMFAAIVPATPWKMALTGFLAASMDPVTMWIAAAAGHYHPGSWADPLVMHYPSFLLLGVAVVISHVMTRLGQQVSKARAMGSYQLGELLGRGGMGEVYTARHRMFARTAAIKLIRPEMIAGGHEAGTEVAVKRFRREAEAAATLRSPHTVELYDFGLTDDGTLYFVMELLEGMDLDGLVRRFGPQPASRAIYLVTQACASLGEAHARGLVHRDVKPANLHVGHLGLEYDFVKVLDFGLVKSVTAPAGESLATAAHAVPGTPAYMAPEMALGESVDGRADLYALGCVTYFLLTGRQVFEASNALHMIARHIQDTPEPPSCRTELDVPPMLDDLVLACLAKRPEDRPQTAQELAARLEAVPLKEKWTPEKAEQWWNVNLPSAQNPNPVPK